MLSDPRCVQDITTDFKDIRGRFIFGKKLYCANTVTAQFSKQWKCINASCLVTLSQAAANGVAVWQKIVEIVGNDRPLVERIARQEGKG